MNEMLGNHYFQLRNFQLAETAFTGETVTSPANLKMVKKLIICYTQTNKTKLAVSLLKDTIPKNISSIIGSIRNEDDCPCMGLIGQIETGFVVYPDEIEKHTVLGILWLYCDIVTSIQYFKMVLNQEPKNEQINSILQLIETHYQNSNHQFNP